MIFPRFPWIPDHWHNWLYWHSRLYRRLGTTTKMTEGTGRLIAAAILIGVLIAFIAAIVLIRTFTVTVG